ncbi:hypothetical protein AA0114_g1004 [Alternaria tenuissima]|uniref:Uncharacterized protein n=1 Tax=Alternaria tenuissima TaxID=119927 RepID=A0A4Q4MW20_9PLEO|nr:hypothetical protein AA0114_g1004 [Alternaria tenuissima]
MWKRSATDPPRLGYHEPDSFVHLRNFGDTQQFDAAQTAA